MLEFIISFLVLLNPFALFMYLNQISKDLNHKDFLGVLLKAGKLSLLIFLIITLFGKTLFEGLLFIDPASFKVFGGVVITIYALTFILQGRKSFFILKGSLDDLAGEIALPFMVGPATVSLCIIIGSQLSPLRAVGVIIIATVAHTGIVFLLFVSKYIVLKERIKVAFDKTVGMLLRLNGFIVGTIGLNLIFSGIKSFFFNC